MNLEQPKRGLLVIPCLNEAERLAPVLAGVHRVLPDVDMVVVDDASTDATAAVARRAGARVLSHGTNMGYGAALETGYLYAVRHGYDYLLQMDGDGQHLPEELPALRAPILDGTADIVIGSRYTETGVPRLPIPLLRRMGHRVFSGLVFLCCGRRMQDPTSGFQVLTRRAFTFFADGAFPCDYPDADVIVMASLAGLRLREVPVRMMPRAGGTSMHAGLRPLYYGIKMLLSLFVVLLNYRRWRCWREPMSGKES